MQTEPLTTASVRLDPRRSTKGREDQCREKQRLKKKVQRQGLMAAITEAANAATDQPSKRRPRRAKPPQGVLRQPNGDSPYLTTREAAAYLKLSRQFLEAARWRGDGSGPAYIKVGRSVRYSKPVLDTWMTAHDHPPDRPIKSK
jgi:excisionase family DNA binding protein